MGFDGMLNGYEQRTNVSQGHHPRFRDFLLEVIRSLGAE